MAPPLTGDSTDLQVADVGDIAETANKLRGEAIEDMTEQERPLGLLSLPSEIWMKICRLAVTREEAIMLLPETPTSFRGKWQRPKWRAPQGSELRAEFDRKHNEIVQQPPITKTCRKTREEILPFFYSSNDFIVVVDEGFIPVFDWLAAIGPGNRKHVNVFVRLEGAERGSPVDSPGSYCKSYSHDRYLEVKVLFKLQYKAYWARSGFTLDEVWQYRLPNGRRYTQVKIIMPETSNRRLAK